MMLSVLKGYQNLRKRINFSPNTNLKTMRTFILIVLTFCLVSVLAETPTYFFSHPNKVS